MTTLRFQFLEQLVMDRLRPKYPHITSEGFLLLCVLLNVNMQGVLHGVQAGEDSVELIMLPADFDEQMRRLEAEYSEEVMRAALALAPMVADEREDLESALIRQMSKPTPVPLVPMSDYTDEMWQTALDYFDHKCAYCGKREGLLRGFQFVREHVIPVSNPECPGATPDNIVPACGYCNVSKNSSDARLWLEDKYGERKADKILSRIETYFEAQRSAARAAANEGAER